MWSYIDHKNSKLILLSRINIHSHNSIERRKMSVKKDYFSELLESGNFSDLDLVSREGETIKAHKCIVARDPIFKFKKGYLIESNTTYCDFLISSKCLRWFITNIYMGNYGIEKMHGELLLTDVIELIIFFFMNLCPEQTHPFMPYLTKYLKHYLVTKITEQEHTKLLLLWTEFSHRLTPKISEMIKNLLPRNLDDIELLLCKMEVRKRDITKKDLQSFCKMMLTSFCNIPNQEKRKIDIVNRFRALCSPDELYLPPTDYLVEIIDKGNCIITMRYLLSLGVIIPYTIKEKKPTIICRGKEEKKKTKDFYIERKDKNIITYFTKTENHAQVTYKMEKYGKMVRLLRIFDVSDSGKKNSYRKYRVIFSNEKDTNDAFVMINK